MSAAPFKYWHKSDPKPLQFSPVQKSEAQNLQCNWANASSPLLKQAFGWTLRISWSQQQTPPHAPLYCNYLCRVLNKHNHSCAEKQRAARAVHRGELCCHRISPQTNLRPYFTRRQMDLFPGHGRLGCNSRQTQKVSEAPPPPKKITAAFMRRPML